MTTAPHDADLRDALPDAAAIRDRLAQIRDEVRTLRALLAIAERRERLAHRDAEGTRDA
ncbi:MAG: hypothetical protein WD049_09815 [Candidatus Paceibacterota bacterium]